MSYVRLSLRNKLLFSFLCSALITAVVGLMGMQAINKANRRMNNFVNTEQKNLIESERLQVLALEHRRYEKDFFLNIGNEIKQAKYLKKFDFVYPIKNQYLW